MSTSPLSTYAGPIAVIAGGVFALAHAAMFTIGDPSDLVAMMTDPLFRVFNAAYAVAFPLLLIALVALYWRQASQTGLFGAVAFCTALTGTVALGGDMWFEGFAVPWLAEVAPAVVSAGPPTGSPHVTAAVVSFVLFSLGWVMFGLASLWSRPFPRVLSVAVAVGGLIGFWAGTPPWGVALGLAVAAVGVWLVRHPQNDQGVQTPAVEPVAVAVNR